jgi:arylsulfatase A-like enzyme
MQNGTGLPFGRHTALVQTTDLTPTLLDLMDLREPSPEVDEVRPATGVSLEALVHGWTRPPVHDRLYFADIGHAAVRTRDWKLISPVSAPWQLRDESAMLFALSEDPSEHFNLVGDRKLGPVGDELLGSLRAQLARPETLGSAP